MILKSTVKSTVIFESVPLVAVLTRRDALCTPLFSRTRTTAFCALALNQTELPVSMARSAGLFARPGLAVEDLLILN